MEISEIRDPPEWRLRGFNMLGEDGMPFITVEANLINSDEPRCINVLMHLLTSDGNPRDVSEVILQKLRPRVHITIERLRSIIGNLPLQFFKCSTGPKEADTDWLQ